MVEDETAGLPGSIDEVSGKQDYENPLQASPVGRPHIGAINMTKSQVFGESPEDWRKANTVEFVRRVAVALERHLATHRLPVVLIADAAIQGHFQKLADLGSLLAGVVETNPQVLDVSSIHVAAYDAVRPIFDEGRNRAVDRLSAVVGSRDSHATLDAREIVKAAYLGQVETLMLTEGAGLWGRFDKEVTWTDKAVHVNLTRDQVSKSPAYDPSTTADRAYQDRLYQHYGYQGY